MSIEQIRQSEFFAWFALQPDGPDRAQPDVSVQLFRPEAPSFKPLVWVELTIGSGGGLQRMRLSVSRSLIDNPATSATARDIVRSFIGFVRSGDAPPAGLLEEIQFRDLPGPVLVGSMPQLPTTPSPLFQVVAGKLLKGQIIGGRTEIAAQNFGCGQSRELLLTAIPSARRRM